MCIFVQYDMIFLGERTSKTLTRVYIICFIPFLISARERIELVAPFKQHLFLHDVMKLTKVPGFMRATQVWHCSAAVAFFVRIAAVLLFFV